MKRGGRGHKSTPKEETVVPTTLIGQQFYEYSKILDARVSKEDQCIENNVYLVRAT